VNFDPRAIELAIKFAGADHILAGSDYPHAIGSIPYMMKALNAIQVSDADRAAIFGGNAAKLYNLG
jgi:aminocarboxymuconate-semialdehyde decarboxylase